LELSKVTDTTTGTVTWFGTGGKNYGFIQPDGGGPQMFCHYSAVGTAGLRGLEQGDRVEYSVEIDKRSDKPCAANLKLI
jgi:cold shock protein